MFGVLPALAASDQRLGIALNEESRGGTGSVQVAAAALRARRRRALAVAGPARRRLAAHRQLQQPDQRAAGIPAGAARRSRASTCRGRDMRTQRARRPSSTTSPMRLARSARDSARRRDDVAAVRRLGLAAEPDHRTPDRRSRRSRCARILAWSRPATSRRWGSRWCAGRGFTDHDAETSGNVVIINESAARRYWPNEDPIGQRISLGAADELARDRRHRRRHAPRRARRRRRSGGLPAAAPAIPSRSAPGSSGR